MKGMLNDVARFVSEKLADLMYILNESIDCIYPLVDSIEVVCDKMFTPRSFKSLLKDLRRVLPPGWNVLSKMTLPITTIHNKEVGTCDVGIVDKGMTVHVETNLRYPRLLIIVYGGGVEMNVKVDVWYTKGYFYGIPIYPLFILYKYTTLGDRKEYEDILKAHGIYDVIRYVSEVDYVVKYPIFEGARDLFGRVLDEWSGYYVEKVRDVIHEKMKTLIGELRRLTRDLSIVRLWKDDRAFGVKLSIPYEAYVECKRMYKLSVGDLIRAIDESIFALAYHAAVLTNMYKYLSGEV